MNYEEGMNMKNKRKKKERKYTWREMRKFWKTMVEREYESDTIR